jgi:hypothetical protein
MIDMDKSNLKVFRQCMLAIDIVVRVMKNDSQPCNSVDQRRKAWT